MHRVWVAMACVVLGACGAQSAARPEATSVAAGRPTGEPLVEEITIRPSGAAASTYAAADVPVPEPTPMGVDILAAVERTAVAHGVPVPTPDGRLYVVAHDLAAAMPQGTTLPAAASEFLVSHYGILEPIPGQLIFWSRADAAVMPAAARERLDGLIRRGDYSRVGMATVARGDGAACTVVLLLESGVDAEPVPRRLTKVTRFRARIAPRYRLPHLVITDSAGVVRTLTLDQGDGGRVRARISCARVGRQQVELMAEDDTGPTVLANFPVWCGAEPPGEIAVRVYPNAFALTETAVEERLVVLTNRARAQAGLESLRLHEGLAQVARGHSREMARTGVVAHTSPETGTAADRVRAAGIATALLQENVARSMGPEEAHDSLMNSPSHRANILSPEATHIGVGVIRDPDSERALLVTELFMRIPPRVDPEEAARTLTGRIASAGMKKSDVLARIATAQAQALAAGADADAVAAAVAKKLTNSSEPFTRVRTIVSALGRLESFDPAMVHSDRAMSHFGVGVAQGTHPRLGENTFHVVVVVARRARGRS